MSSYAPPAISRAYALCTRSNMENLIDLLVSETNDAAFRAIMLQHINEINAISLYNRRNKSALLKTINTGLGKTFTERLYNFVHQRNEIAVCEVCNANPLKWQGNLKKGYYLTCSAKCFPQHPQYQANYAKTMIEKYGVDNAAKSKIIQHKIAQTTMDRHGVRNGFQTAKARHTLKMNSILKYGTEHHLKSAECHTKIKNTYFTNLWNDKIKAISAVAVPLFNAEDFDSVYKIYDWNCIRCNVAFRDTLNYGVPRCPSCDRMHGRSRAEHEVFTYVDNLLGSGKTQMSKMLLRDGKTRRQIDVFIPSMAIGIEYNGLYWHSINAGIDKNYHVKKLDMAEAHGIKLVNIFEDDWILKNERVKSRLCDLFGTHEIRIDAGLCAVVPISSHESCKFLSECHLQGGTEADLHLALVQNDEIVAVMAFRKARNSKKSNWELLRYANKLHTAVPGGLARLFSHFTSAYMAVGQTTISYADRCWDEACIHEQLGFAFSHNTQPAIWYVNKRDNIRMPAAYFQKHELPAILPSFDIELTELQNMMVGNYLAIADCGNAVFVYTKK